MNKTIGIPAYDHIKTGDQITVTDGLKRALDTYQHMSGDTEEFSIEERQAQCVHVVTELWRASNGRH